MAWRVLPSQGGPVPIDRQGRQRLTTTMAVTEWELGSVLDHCRRLLDAADQLDHVAHQRAEAGEAVTRRWEGPHRRTFDGRVGEESAALGRRARAMRAEAEGWARVWAHEVNRVNQERYDLTHQPARPFQPVAVPTMATRFAATGGLELF